MFHIKPLANSLKIVYTKNLAHGLHTTATCTSVFMKRQKKIDPEIAKQREIRKRRKLEKEIREMQKNSKKVKPQEEMSLDADSLKNINERVRPQSPVTDQQYDKRSLILKEYGRSRNQLMVADDLWMRNAIRMQKKALMEIKILDLNLYKEAVKEEMGYLPQIIHGPTLTPPANKYESPDGDYIDTTKTWTN